MQSEEELRSRAIINRLILLSDSRSEGTRGLKTHTIIIVHRARGIVVIRICASCACCAIALPTGWGADKHRTERPDRLKSMPVSAK